MDHKNTKAKYLLEDVDFSHEEAHLAYTLGSGAASGMNESYVLKSDNISLSQEELQIIDDIVKAESDVVLEMSFQEFLEKFMHMYGENAQMLCKLMGYSYEDETYPMNEKQAREMVDQKLSRIHLMRQDDMSLSDMSVLRKAQEVFEKSEGDLPNSAFAYVPDKDKTSTRKLRIDDANHTRAAVAALGEGFRGNKVEIPEKDLPAVKRKVRAAYKKYFPDNEVPDVLKSLDNDSDALSGSNDTADHGINKNKEEITVTDKVELSKAEHEELLNQLAIFKAKEEESILKSKVDFIKSADFITEIDSVAELLVKSEEASLIESIISKAVEAIEKAKEEGSKALTEELSKTKEELEKAKEDVEKAKEEFAGSQAFEGDNSSLEDTSAELNKSEALANFIKENYKG